MKPRTIFVFALFHTGIICLADPSCSRNEPEECMAPLTLDHEKFYHISSHEELQSECKRREEFAACIYGYFRRCVSDIDQPAYKPFIGDSYQFFLEFCNTEPGHSNIYVNSLGCFNSISSELDKCAESYDRYKAQIDEGSFSPSVLRDICCSYFDRLQCTWNVTNDRCGGDPAEAMVNKMVNLAGKFFNDRCQKYLIQCQNSHNEL